MTEKNWKKRERKIAAALGSSGRTGPTGRDDSDIRHPLLAVEVKTRKALPKWALDCLAQARAGRTAAGKTPTVILLGHRMRIIDGLVVMRVADFQELFGKIEAEEATA